MKFFNKFNNFALSAAIALSVFAFPLNVNAAESDVVTIDIFSINDFHGALQETGEKDKNMGAAKLVTAVNELKAENENSIVVSAGDNYNGSALSNLLYGAPVNDMFKQMGLTLSAVGNHEFDWGIDKIEQWKKDGVTFLAANIVDKETSEIPAWIKPYEIVEIDGVKVGFIGLTTPETAIKTSPEIVSGLSFLNTVETAKKYVPIVREDGADVVVLLTHIGSYQDGEAVSFESDSIGLETAGADAIITSHSHKTVSGEIDSTPVVQGYYNGRAVTNIQIDYDTKEDEIKNITYGVNELYKNKADYADDAKTVEIVNKYSEEVSPILDKELGVATTPLTRTTEDLSTLGEWTANVMLDASGAEIAATNAGGLRADINEGLVTMGTMYTVMPFDNVNSVWEMKGSDVKELFEYGFDNKINDPNMSFMQFAGVSVVYDENRPEGDRVVSLTLTNGDEVNADDTYKVVTNDFMASGGDGYSMFKKGTMISEADPIRDLMAERIVADKGIDFTPKGLITRIAKTETEVIEEPAVEVTEPVAVTPEVITPIAPVVVTPVAPAVSTYKVVSGDNLTKIAKTYNTTWQELQKLNNLKNPNLIFPGDVIILPAM